MERGKGQIVLSEDWLRMIMAEREREIEATRVAHAARAARPSRAGRFRTWLDGRVTTGPAPIATARQTGRAATDLSA